MTELLEKHHARRIVTLWIINGIAATISLESLPEIAQHSSVEHIQLDRRFSMDRGFAAGEAQAEWNIALSGVPGVWDKGVTGERVVVAVADTGVDLQHPDLKDRWRGGTNSWFDPYGEHTSPYDSDGHGTRVLGVILGGAGSGAAIGVAPGAQWIAVKMFDDAGLVSLSAVHQSFQWLLDPDGNPQTDDAPHVVNHSWGLRDALNQCHDEFEEDVRIIKAAGIGMVFAAGNDGPGSATSLSPANFSDSLSVGSVNEDLALSFFSSRGPSACDNGTYPSLVAPGEGILTTDITADGIVPGSYVSASGTSLAAAHVAGVMALLMCAFPSVAAETIETAMLESAEDLGPAGKDNQYGAGLVNAAAAYEHLSSLMSGCSDADQDSYFDDFVCGGEQDCDDLTPTVYPGAPEIKHDGIDQDCNGYDLTIDVLKAVYFTGADVLVIEATSDLMRSAALEVEGYGAMRWRPLRKTWTIVVLHAGSHKESVTVSGKEGAVSVPLTSISHTTRNAQHVHF